MPEIDNLVEKLVDEHKVLADGLLVHGLEVRLERLHDFVQQLKDHRCVHVVARNRNNKELALHDVAEGGSAHRLHRCADLLLVQNVVLERRGNHTADVLLCESRNTVRGK